MGCWPNSVPVHDIFGGHVNHRVNILFYKVKGNKKDGYRQQNVRQRQKLISIIDYDVCMTFY